MICSFWTKRKFEFSGGQCMKYAIGVYYDEAYDDWEDEMDD